jgi:ankyrin repeat protein
MKNSKNRETENRRMLEQALRQMAASGQQAGALGGACQMGYSELVREFLQAGFDVNGRDPRGFTPLNVCRG